MPERYEAGPPRRRVPKRGDPRVDFLKQISLGQKIDGIRKSRGDRRWKRCRDPPPHAVPSGPKSVTIVYGAPVKRCPRLRQRWMLRLKKVSRSSS